MRNKRVTLAAALCCAIWIVVIDLFSQYSTKFVKMCFLRSMGIVSMFCFISMRVQVLGLIGINGLIPVTTTLNTIKAIIKRTHIENFTESIIIKLLGLVYDKYYTTSDQNSHLILVTNVDIILSMVAVVYPHPLLFAYLYISYYGLKRICSSFLNYQWDALFLESLILTILLSISFDDVSATLALWQIKLLLFRLMFGSGVVKYFGRDTSWHTEFNAMSYHFLTQPLPNEMARQIFCRLSPMAFKVMTVGTIVVELIVPLFILIGSQRINSVVALCFVALQISIGLSGYYGFFGTLSCVLCFSLLPDSTLLWPLLQALRQLLIGQSVDTVSMTLLSLIATLVASIVFYPAWIVLATVQIVAISKLLDRTRIFTSFMRQQQGSSPISDDSIDVDQNEGVPSIVDRVMEVVEYVHIVLARTLYVGGHYGLFATMTKVRNELTLEVSDDLSVWQSVEFRYKPGSMHIAPKAVTPFFHMPRLDWCMWFLPLQSGGKYQYPRWFWVLLAGILEGNKDILALLHPEAVQLLSCASDSRDDKDHSEKARDELKSAKKFIRVTISNYVFSPPGSNNTDSNSLPDTTTGAPHVCSYTHTYWKVTPLTTIQGPISLDGLYTVLDAFDQISCGVDKKVGMDGKGKPTVETAADIITRMMLKNRDTKNKKKE